MAPSISDREHAGHIQTDAIGEDEGKKGFMGMIKEVRDNCYREGAERWCRDHDLEWTE